MTINEAIKTGKAIEVEMDTYLLDDGRVLRYDRFFGRRGTQARWIDEQGWAYRNFFEAYEEICSFSVRVFGQ